MRAACLGFTVVAVSVGISLPAGAGSGTYLKQQFGRSLLASDGINPLAPAGQVVKGFRCYETIALPDVCNPLENPRFPDGCNTEPSLTTTYYEERTALRESLGFSLAVSASATFLAGSGSAEVAFSSLARVSEDSRSVTFVLKAEQVFPDKVSVALPSLSETGRTFRTTAARVPGDTLDDEWFYQQCGREFVVRTGRRHRLAVLLKMTANNRDEARAAAEKARVSWEGIGFSGDISASKKESWASAVSSVQTTIEFTASGGPGLAALGGLIGQPGDMDAVRSTVKAYLEGLTAQNSADYDYLTADGTAVVNVEAVNGFPEKKYGVFNDNSVVLDALVEKFAIAQEELARAKEILDRENLWTKYPPQGGLAQLYDVRALRELWTDYRLEVLERGKRCMFGELTPPIGVDAPCSDLGLNEPRKIQALTTSVPPVVVCDPAGPLLFEFTDFYPKRQFELRASFLVANRKKGEYAARFSNTYRQLKGAPGDSVSSLSQPFAYEDVSSNAGSKLSLFKVADQDGAGCRAFEGENTAIVRDFSGQELTVPILRAISGTDNTYYCNSWAFLLSCGGG